MIKLLRISAVVFSLVFLLAGCQRSEKIVGNGAKETITRNLAAFNSIELSGNYQVVLVGEMAQHVALTADSNLLQYITTSVQDNTLQIKTANKVDISSKVAPTLEIFVPTLQDVKISGNSQINITRLDTDHLTVTIEGTGKANVSGVAKKLDVVISGAGEMNAQDLKAQEVNVDIKGSANATVNAENNLKVKVAGTGLVEYYGSPKNVSQDIQGSGRVIGISNAQKSSS